MIEINLLPPELRPKKQRLEFTPENLLYLILFVIGTLLVVHVYLAGHAIITAYQFKSLNNKWQQLEPQRKVVGKISRQYSGFTQDVVVLQQLLKQRVGWAEKLNALSLDLPAGIWFNELKVLNKDFTLKGCVFSLTKQELGQINKFLDNLRADRAFFGDFSGLELGPVQKSSIGSYEVAEFVISGKLK